MHDGGGLTIRFWGTRGSLPSPGPDTTRYGGNTSCVEVRAGEHLLIFDAGTGIRELGNRLLRDMPITAHLFFTHYHWDHIMGFPFFGPLFVPGNTLHLYGATKAGCNVKEVLAGQMVAPYFPVTMEEEGKSDLVPHPMEPGDRVEIGGEVVVRSAHLNHPGEAMAFRVDYRGRSVVYATDIEHDPDHDPALIELAREADALIYDSTYTDAEYAGHIGWGHSTWRAGVEIAKAAKVRQFIIFHHLPERTDREVAAIERAARRTFSGSLAAREGMELTYPAVEEARPTPRRNGVPEHSTEEPAAAGEQDDGEEEVDLTK
ncbi:MAG: MBL fold metallo-hydrolase [Deltaproteobacteria bacterium]|nr:MAG: MBL fold metallo-hydrolase [Deltaproteobacteria bacterium]